MAQRFTIRDWLLGSLRRNKLGVWLGAFVLLAVISVGLKVVVELSHSEPRGIVQPREPNTVPPGDPTLQPESRKALTVHLVKPEDNAIVDRIDDTILLDIHSPSGIGSAEIKRTGDSWPVSVTLRLHLHGLESLTIASKARQLTASISSGERPVQRLEWQHGDQAPQELSPDDPHWTVIRMIGADGQPAREIPLRDGCFELLLPRGLFDDNPRAITINWIDFYRN